MELPVPPPSYGVPDVNVISAQKPNHKKKFIILGTLAVLIIGIIAAVVLVQVQQRINIDACDCTKLNFYVDAQGNVSVSNAQTISEPAEQVNITINGSHVATLDVPALAPGQNASLGTVTVPTSGEFTWSATGSLFCSDSGSHVAPTPIISPTPEVTATPIPSPTEEITPTVTATPIPSPTEEITPTVTATPIPSPTEEITPTVTATPTLASTPTPTLNPPDNPPSPPNSCNGACSSTANCTKAEDGVQLICIQNHCRYPSCTDQESCHCPGPYPTSRPSPTPTQNLATSGAALPTIITAAGGLLMVALGILLAL